MAQAVTLLQLSPTMTEGTLVKWLVKEGEKVSSAQPIAEVETDKAVMEQESFEDGTILKLIAKEGAKVPVGNLIAVIGEAGEDISSIVSGAGGGGEKAEGKAKKDKKQPAKKEAPAKAEEEDEPELDEENEALSSQPIPSVKEEAGEGTEPEGERVLASPLARKMAKDAKLNLSGIKGSGPKGRVVKSDVEAAIAAGAKPAAAKKTTAPAAVQEAGGVEYKEEIALSGMRQTIARRLTESKQSIPHFQLTVDVRGEKLLAAVAKVRDAYPDSKVTVTHFLIKALANTQMRHKAIRSQWAGEKLLVVGAAHISVAIAIETGLVAPVLRNVQSKGVLQIAQELRDVADLARNRKLKPEDMTGGTQTLSNLGMFGIKDFTAIINPPETSILAAGALEDRPVVENGQIVPGKVMTLTLSCDHRVIDGAVGAAFMADLKKALEEPMLMLL